MLLIHSKIFVCKKLGRALYQDAFNSLEDIIIPVHCHTLTLELIGDISSSK